MMTMSMKHKMHRVLLLMVVSVAACQLSTGQAVAQPLMRDVFLQMPDSLFPYLTENSRLDFLDFMDSNMKAEVRNELGGKSVMTVLTPSGLEIQLSELAHVAMRLLPVSEDIDSCRLVVCMITTYGRPAPTGDTTEAPSNAVEGTSVSRRLTVAESSVRLFSVRWRELPVANYLTLPAQPWTAVFMEQPQLGLSLTQTLIDDFPANEDQRPIMPWKRVIVWGSLPDKN